MTEVIIDMQLNGEALQVREPDVGPEAGSRVSLCADPAAVCVFDHLGGVALT